MQQDPGLFNAIYTYFDALYHCDTKLLDEVFHPASTLFDVDKEEVFVDPIANFRADVGSRSSPASIKQPRQQEIIMIDWLSANAVTVKVRLRSMQNIFVDHLCLVKAQTQWQIVSKVWHLESTC